MTAPSISSVHLEATGAARASDESSRSIDTADHVLHAPSGETWVVAYVRGDRLSACGWPDTMACLSDCSLVQKATPEQRLRLLNEMAGSDGHRARYAQEALKRTEASE